MKKKGGGGYSRWIPIFFGMVLAVVLLFGGIGVASATTVYVATDGSGDYNCDGIDDQNEINWALENAFSGDTVHINAGTYNIDNTIWMNGIGITLEGDGDASILRITDGATNPPWSQTTPMITINNAGITLQNLKIDGNYNSQTLPGGANYLDLIHVKSDNAIIQDCSFYNGLCDAIEGYTVENMTVRNNGFYDIDHDSVAGRYSNSIISDNLVRVTQNDYSANSAFRLTMGDYNIWRNNTINRASGITRIISMGFEIYSYNDNSNCHGLIENNTIIDTYANAIVFERTSSSPTTDWTKCTNYTIRNNIINNVVLYASKYSNGIKIWDTHWNNFTIENNVIYSAAGDGIWLGKNTADIVIKNNIIVENGRNGIVVWGASNISNSYNDVWNNGDGNHFGISAGTGDISVNPLFADPNGDFHLRSTGGRWTVYGWIYTDTVDSPCIDIGDSSSDYSNEPEPNGGRINMGAYGNTDEASLSLGVTTGTISGTVMDMGTGGGIGNAIITGEGIEEGFLFFLFPTPYYFIDTADIDGSFTITNVPAGTYTITSSASGYENVSKSDITVNEGKTTTVNFQLVAVTDGQPTGTISGTVTDENTSIPIQGTTVTADGHSTTTNSGGGYTITLPAGGDYTVTSSKNGYHSQSQKGVEVTADYETTVNSVLSKKEPLFKLPSLPTFTYNEEIIFAGGMVVMLWLIFVWWKDEPKGKKAYVRSHSKMVPSRGVPKGKKRHINSYLRKVPRKRG